MNKLLQHMVNAGYIDPSFLSGLPKAQGGGTRPPIFTDDRNKVKAYTDSLSAYNSESRSVNALNKWNKNPTEDNKQKYWKEQLDNYDWSSSYTNSQGLKKEGLNPISNYWSTNSAPDGDPDNIWRYKKPVQPYIYKQPKRLGRTNYTPELLSYGAASQQGSINMKAPNIPQQQNDYRVDYIDPETGRATYKDFINWQMGDEFMKSLEGNRTGYYKRLDYGGYIPKGQNGFFKAPVVPAYAQGRDQLRPQQFIDVKKYQDNRSQEIVDQIRNNKPILSQGYRETPQDTEYRIKKNIQFQQSHPYSNIDDTGVISRSQSDRNMQGIPEAHSRAYYNDQGLDKAMTSLNVAGSASGIGQITSNMLRLGASALEQGIGRNIVSKSLKNFTGRIHPALNTLDEAASYVQLDPIGIMGNKLNSRFYNPTTALNTVNNTITGVERNLKNSGLEATDLVFGDNNLKNLSTSPTSRITRGPINYWEEPKFAERNPSFNPEKYANKISQKVNLEDLPDNLKPFMERDLTRDKWKAFNSEQRRLRTNYGLGYDKYDYGGQPCYECGGMYPNGGPIIDPMGQWAHPGQVTRIPGSKITMGPDPNTGRPITYPVLGIGSNGQKQMMYPNQQYSFGGADHVDEYPMMQSGGSFLEKLKSTLNPYNWGVDDYSEEKDFSKAYSTAKKAGEEEFIYNNKRYNTKYAGTPRQEVGRYGIKGKLLNQEVLNNPTQANLYPPLGTYVPGHISAQVLKKGMPSIDYSSYGNNIQGIGSASEKGEKSYYSYGVNPDKFYKKAASLPIDENNSENKLSTWNLFNNNCADNVCDAYGVPRSPVIELPDVAIKKIKKKYPTLDVTGRTASDYIELASDLQGGYPKDILPKANYILGIINSPEFRKNNILEGVDKSLVGSIQQALYESGYNLPNSKLKNRQNGSNFDGVFGKETNASLKDWQNKNKSFELGGTTKMESGLLSKKVSCSNCGWSWEAVDGGSDPLTCHKCGGMVQMKSGGQHGGLDRWFAEKWIDVKTGKDCGRQEGETRAGYPACRPSKRVNSQTPKTSSEMSSAEKAKFKSSKTSSQRINYNHKRN